MVIVGMAGRPSLQYQTAIPTISNGNPIIIVIGPSHHNRHWDGNSDGRQAIPTISNGNPIIIVIGPSHNNRHWDGNSDGRQAIPTISNAIP
jgi:hypothetical protein